MSSTAAAVQGLSLDGFMARHTSEDNASFSEIVDRSNKRRRATQPWLFEDPNPVCSQYPTCCSLPQYAGSTHLQAHTSPTSTLFTEHA